MSCCMSFVRERRGQMKGRCWAEINLEALRSNLEVCSGLTGSPTGIMAIVKADAYGHGLSEMVQALSESGVNWFGVANLAEAQETRTALNSDDPNILILSPLIPDERIPAIEGGFVVCISDGKELAAFDESAADVGKQSRVHLSIDTGMGRMGVHPDGFSDLLEKARQAQNCFFEGVCSHFPSADEEAEFTRDQIALFENLVADLRGENCEIHLGNSAGLLGYSGRFDFCTLARPGLALFWSLTHLKTGRELAACFDVENACHSDPRYRSWSFHQLRANICQ